jgi:hypothetical protein
MTTGALRVDLPGEVIRPGDATYDEVRAVFNGMIDHRPLAVLRCRETPTLRGASRSPASTTCHSQSAAAATTSQATPSATTASCSTCRQ